jgi:Uma2 family endonuclease
MTTDEFLAIPDDGIERWLIRGHLREKQTSPLPRTEARIRDRRHGRLMVRIVYLLEKWLQTQAQPRGQILCGEAGCRLRRNPDSTVGIDVVYIAANLAQKESNDTTLIDGVPVLAVEILSPNDTVEEINEKIDDYLAAGVALVWVVNPHDQTITIYRANTEPELVNVRQELSGEPHLPGFRVAAAEVFA